MVRWKGSERIGEDECTLITVINHSLFSWLEILKYEYKEIYLQYVT